MSTLQYAKIIASYDTMLTNGCNQCVKEISYPKRTELCVGASVMLLKNFIVEWKIMNGSIGIVCQIIYDQPQGQTNDIKYLPSYVIIELPSSTIPNNNKCVHDKPSTWIPIPMATERFEKKLLYFFYHSNIRVCIAITIHKSHKG